MELCLALCFVFSFDFSFAVISSMLLIIETFYWLVEFYQALQQSEISIHLIASALPLWLSWTQLLSIFKWWCFFIHYRYCDYISKAILAARILNLGLDWLGWDRPIWCRFSRLKWPDWAIPMGSWIGISQSLIPCLTVDGKGPLVLHLTIIYPYRFIHGEWY